MSAPARNIPGVFAGTPVFSVLWQCHGTGIAEGDFLDSVRGFAVRDHCAGIVDRKPGYDPKVYAVNVQGTEIVARKPLEAGGRLIYISSVHAMPPGKGRQPMPPATVFDPDTVIGLYSKAEAEASRRVQALMKQGLDAVIVQPSGLIGPNDYDHTNMSEFFCEAASGKLPACVKAGYSFVDVRDAAQMIVAACTRGVSGQSYLAAGPTVSMMKLAVMAARISHTRPVALELPLDVVLAVTPVTALCYRLSGKKPLFTAFAVQTLESDSNFDVSKSVEDLGFSCRPLKETVTDIIRFQQGIFRLDADAILTPQGPVRAKNGKSVWTKTALAAAAIPPAAWPMAGCAESPAGGADERPSGRASARVGVIAAGQWSGKRSRW